MRQQFILSMLVGLALLAFQNCSDAVPTGQGEAKLRSSNGLPNPSPNPSPMPSPGSAPTISYSPANPQSVNAVTLSASGGSPGYTYTKVAGGGILAGNVYSPGAAGGAAVFEVTDSAGRKSTLNINIAVAPTITIYRFGGDAAVATAFHNDVNGGGGMAGARSVTGSFKIFQNALGGSMSVIKCMSGGRDFIPYVYFTTNGSCAAGYVSGGVFGYSSSNSGPNTAPAPGDSNIAGYLPNY